MFCLFHEALSQQFLFHFRSIRVNFCIQFKLFNRRVSLFRFRDIYSEKRKPKQKHKKIIKKILCEQEKEKKIQVIRQSYNPVTKYVISSLLANLLPYHRYEVKEKNRYQSSLYGVTLCCWTKVDLAVCHVKFYLCSKNWLLKTSLQFTCFESNLSLNQRTAVRGHQPVIVLVVVNATAKRYSKATFLCHTMPRRSRFASRKVYKSI